MPGTMIYQHEACLSYRLGDRLLLSRPGSKVFVRLREPLQRFSGDLEAEGHRDSRDLTCQEHWIRSAGT